MKKLSLFIVLITLSLVACRFDIGDNSSKEKSSDKKDSDNPIAQALEELSNGKKVETVEYEVLEELLPERLGGYTRDEDVEASKTGILGMSVSTASATYRDGDDKIELALVDTGGLGIAAAMASWSNLEFDKKDKNGFERTSEMDGHKTFEQFRKKGNSEFAMLYKDRYLITASGRVSDFDDLKDFVKKLKLRKLPEA